MIMDNLFKRRRCLMKLYNIYYDQEKGEPPIYQGTTNNLDKWLEENNTILEKKATPMKKQSPKRNSKTDKSNTDLPKK